jgi:AraC-like DNA-binding protein
MLDEKMIPGLFRSAVGGKGSTLTNAFANLESEHISGCTNIIRKGDLLCVEVPIPGETADQVWEMCTFQPGLHMVVTNCVYAQAHEEVVPGEGFIEFHYNIGGETRLSVDTTQTDDIELGESVMLLCRQDRGINYSVFFPPGQRRLVSIYIHPAILLNQFDIDFDSLDDPQKSLFITQSDQIVLQQISMNVTIFNAVKAIVENGFERGSRVRFFHAKCWELLCLSTQEIIKSSNFKDVDLRFNARDLKMFDQARQILETQFNPAPTVESLSRAVGTNTNKLKSGFKAIYGMTVFDYGLRQRMAHAMGLLANDGVSASEVSKAIGYSNQASFSTAFKKFYGHTPRDARRSTSKFLVP